MLLRHPVFDWVNAAQMARVREAWIRSHSGAKVVDFADHTLHLMSYSTPIQARMSIAELKRHLHADPAYPTDPVPDQLLPENWGFCLPWNQAQALPEGEYEVLVDTALAPGSLHLWRMLHPRREPGTRC